MLSLKLFLAAVALLAASGIPACFMAGRARLGQYTAAFLLMLGGATGLVSLCLAFGVPGMETSLRSPWPLPLGEFFIRIDPVSAAFLVPVFTLPFLGTLFGLGYWPHSGSGPASAPGGGKLGLFYGLLAAGMAVVVVARDAVLFLAAWELMATAAFFAATADGKNIKARKAGWIYLATTHAGTLCLFAMFAIWRGATGSFSLLPIRAMDGGSADAVFVLAALGFGFKAGLMPLHFWLPDFYTHAPSHVSGVLSGVMSKMGIYGLVRICGLLPAPELWWGGALLTAGVLSAIAGILYALGQSDLKRLLAYSSVENIGVIAAGLGLAMIGRSAGRPELILLGLGGAIFHVWNHGLFKSLLFFNAGSVERAAGTRNLNLLGGLGKAMPRTMALFAVGAVAICALPPLNGFASELLIYTGLFKILYAPAGISIAAGAAALLALAGSLALAVFVKAFSTAFLGSPRSALSLEPMESGGFMLATMSLLAVACATLGILPWKLAPFIEATVRSWESSFPSSLSLPGAATPASASLRLESLVPLKELGMATGLLLALLALVASLLLLLLRRRRCPASMQGTWDCGYSRPTNRMQYTGTSIAANITGLFPTVSPIQKTRPRVEGEFPDRSGFKAHMPDTTMDKVVLPVKNLVARAASRMRVIQQGQLSRYLLYIIAITILLLAFGAMGVS